MDGLLFVGLSFITFAIVYILTSPFTFRRLQRLPPGPYPVPLIGNILQLGQNPHHSLARLSKTYGPIMSLKLGSQTTIVVSSPTMAREVLQKNDQFFSSRPIPDAARVHDHHNTAIVWLPASSKWRNLRKICKEQMFSLQKLDETQGLRLQKVKELVEYMSTCSIKGEAVNIGEAAFTTSLNLISNTLFSFNFATFDSSSSQGYKKLVCEVLEIVTKPNLVDSFPILRFIDPQGIRRRSKAVFGKTLNMFENIIKERIHESGSVVTSSRKQDVLEGLIDEMAKDEMKFGMNDMKNLLLLLFVGGSDTTSVTVEWGMTELLRSPETMHQARKEIHDAMGQKKIIEESDISRLPYLQALVKETYRLHPTNPLLIPHRADAKVKIHGYTVPKGADVIVNIWASSRDSTIWPDAEMFLPERFLESNIDVGGQHFELIPFGAGRRMCPRLPLGNRMVQLMLANLIHNFEWKLEEGIKPEDINLEEKYGVSAQKKVPLKAIPVKLFL